MLWPAVGEGCGHLSMVANQTRRAARTFITATLAICPSARNRGERLGVGLNPTDSGLAPLFKREKEITEQPR
jgi:hypothetical protein